MSVKRIDEVYPGTRLREVISSAKPGWSVLNPSIAQGPGGYRCIVRSSNFLARNGGYVVNDPDNIVRTNNYLCDMDDDLNITSMELIDTSPVQPEKRFTLVQDIEDARLFYAWGAWWYSGTSREHLESGIPKIALDELEGTGAKVLKRTYMNGPTDDSCEKNWMPISGRVEWVYSVSPGRVTDGDVLWESDFDEPAAYDFRGSSQVIPINDGEMYVGVIHQVTWEPTRYYWHRFVVFNEAGYAYGWSDCFYFDTQGLEFANGIVEWGDYLAVSFGQGDERARLALVPKAGVVASLTPTTTP